MEILIFVALWFFILTHIDTLVVLIAFCANDKYQPVEIITGHYLGFSIGLALAVIGALFASEFLEVWTFLLGGVPLGLGFWGLLRNRPDIELPEQMDVPSPVDRVGVVTSAGIGLSGENIAVFIPFFSTLTHGELIIVLSIYLGSAGILYMVSRIIAAHTVARGLPDWLADWLVPLSLIIVGLYVLGVGFFAAELV